MARIIFLFLIFPSALFSYAVTDVYVPNCKVVKGSFLFAAETEVTNGQYLLFLNDQYRKHGAECYSSLLPDTSAWLSPGTYCEPYLQYYFRHPAYRLYPMVNVSKRQAEAFCEWMEVQLNEQFEKMTDQPIVSVDVRLPTDQEWQEAARGGNRYAIFPWPGSGMRNTTQKHKGRFMANFSRGQGDYMGVTGDLNDGADITAPVRSYWPNQFGLYNLSGNVAEMLQEEGRTRGGSWASRAPYLEISGVDPFAGFSKPSPEIGFRYFVEVIDRRDCKPIRKQKITARRIEKMLVPVIQDTLMAWKFEISNEWYDEFVQETSDENKPNGELWIGELSYARRFKNDYSTHSDYKNHPVVNISREQALKFCDWLTEKYNQFPKRKYTRLAISLPTEEEWELIASGNNRDNYFPWGGPYAMNSKGEWLCNYNTVQERWIIDLNNSTYLVNGISKDMIQAAAGQDGALVTAPVDSYYDNSLGIKNACGNVSEMVADLDVAKGGNWGSMIHEIGIKKSVIFTKPNPYVGFRFVARVME
ncbi:MAG: SUMF1/EgtB/PvdO family nonheme iron enzyme [Crocinitomicaceae bacterium]|nr:SUMF1/EgtB/PvdO family nonheme iron enzyme [Crocinitomicaceae bacterium]